MTEVTAEEGLLNGVLAKRQSVLDAERPEAVERQHGRGRLTARERVAALVDADSFLEYGGLVQPEHRASGFVRQEGDAKLDAPADGVITGTGMIDGRPVAIVSYDFTVFGGSHGTLGGEKMLRMAYVARNAGMPLVMFLEGGGHRIQDGMDAREYAAIDEIVYVLAALSGWVPVVAAVVGPGFAAPANFAGLADFVIMVRGGSTLGIAGPTIVKASTGEEISQEDLGGAGTQVDRNGIAHLAVDDEPQVMSAIRDYLSYLPSNAEAAPAVVVSQDDPSRADESLRSVVPANTRVAYDVRKVITGIVDHDSLFEIQPTFAKNIITTFARLDGTPVGVIANQPSVLAGTVDTKAAEKAAHFIGVCDAFGLPLIYLIDVPGFFIGSAAESTGLARRSARMLYEAAQSTVPIFSVILRKSYGLGYAAMCGGRSFGAELSVAWPTAEICAMNIDGAVDIVFKKQFAASDDPEGERAAAVEQMRGQVGALRAAEGFGIDDVIDPRETRRILVQAVKRAPARREPLSRARRGISPI